MKEPAPPFADKAILQHDARDSAGDSQGEHEEIAAGHAVKGGFKGSERTAHGRNPSLLKSLAGCRSKAWSNLDDA